MAAMTLSERIAVFMVPPILASMYPSHHSLFGERVVSGHRGSQAASSLGITFARSRPSAITSRLRRQAARRGSGLGQQGKQRVVVSGLNERDRFQRDLLVGTVQSAV